MADSIAAILVPITADVLRPCPTCRSLQPVWVARTTTGDTITVCDTCQSVIHRRAPATPEDHRPCFSIPSE